MSRRAARAEPGAPGWYGIDHLRAFIAVAEELSFRRASERLYVAAPHVSRRIGELERALGVELFDRTTRKVVLTPEGAQLLPRVRRLVAGFDRLGTQRRARHTTVAVGVGSGVVPADRDAVVAAIGRALPDAACEFATGTADELGAKLREGQLDVALLHTPAVDAFETVHLRTQGFAVILAADHPLAAREAVDLPELRELRYITLSARHNTLTHGRIAPLVRAAGIRDHVRLELRYWSDVVPHILGGAAFAIVPSDPENPLRRSIEDPGVRVVPLRGLDVPFTTVLAWLPERADDPAFSLVVEELRRLGSS
jgi:LysR family hydrogen peroxide-inducible transcriptional activator